ncbi:MAG: ABC transporter substrate-binding protein [Geminicoccaceae bacterium]
MTQWPDLRSAALAAALCTAPLSAMADSSITVFDWSGYEDPAFHEAFIEKHGYSPNFAFFADEEEAFQKLRAGFKADVAHPCSQSVPRWREAGLLEPIDPSRITSWDKLNPQLRDLPGFVYEGKPYWVPFEWGNTGLTYRTDQVPAEDVQSLQVFADPKYEGKVSIGDNVDDAYALASLAIGLEDWTQMTDEQFVDASDFLRKVHQNVRLYWTDNADISQAMANGEVLIAWTWNETPTTLAAEGQPVAMNKDTKEGLSTWVCGYALLKDGEGSKDEAYDFLNAVSDARVSPYMVESWGYGHANTEGMAAVDPAILEAKGYADVEKFRDKTLFQSPLPSALRQRMIAEFEQIKAGF